eukprot:158623-Prymnesium_polylepis.2
MHLGDETRMGPGSFYTAVGLMTHSLPWPYALSARSCGARSDHSTVVSECVLPLQCNRLQFPPTSSKYMVHLDPWGQALRVRGRLPIE